LIAAVSGAERKKAAPVQAGTAFSFLFERLGSRAGTQALDGQGTRPTYEFPRPLQVGKRGPL